MLCVLSLELDQTFQVRGLTRLGVALVVGEELHEVLLLVGGEEVQEPHGVCVQPLEGQRERKSTSSSDIDECSENARLKGAVCNIWSDLRFL